jgi:hypothetical protein
MTIEQMQKEIREYCLNLILNSTNEDWDNFTAIIYTDKKEITKYK